MFSCWKSIFTFACANNLPILTLSQYTAPVKMDHSVQTSTRTVFLLQLQILLALQSPLLSYLLDFSTPPYFFFHQFCTSVDVASIQDCRLHTPVCCMSIQTIVFDHHKLKIPQILSIAWTWAETIVKAWVPPSKHSPWSEFLPCKGYWFMPKDIANIFSCLWRSISNFIPWVI